MIDFISNFPIDWVMKAIGIQILLKAIIKLQAVIIKF